MRSIKLLIIGLVLTASSVGFANIRIRTYNHSPCDSWSFNGTCNFHSFRKIGAEGDSVQRALDLLNQKIQRLERQMDLLVEENDELRLKIESK